MSGQPATKYAITAPIDALPTQHVALPTDVVNDHGISGAHDVQHGLVSPRLAPGVQFYGATGLVDPVSSSGKLGNRIASHSYDKHLQGQQSNSLLNAAAPAFIPTIETETHRPQESHSSQTYSISQPSSQDPLLAHNMVWQYPAAQPLTAAECYPSIHHYPVAQQPSAPGYPAAQYGVPPYIVHQYLTPQYGIEFEPSMPMQMISMFSSAQQAMDYQHYLADRARSYDYTEHQHTHPKPSPGKSEQKRNRWQKRRVASYQRGSQEYEYIGYYFRSKDNGRIGHNSSRGIDVSHYLPVIPLEGYFVLGSSAKSSDWEMEEPHGFLPLISSSALVNLKTLHAMGNGM